MVHINMGINETSVGRVEMRLKDDAPNEKAKV